MRRVWTRTLVVAAIVSAAVASSADARPVSAGTGGSPRGARTIQAVSALESQVLAGVNAVRAQRGLRPLRLSPALSRAADSHARDMAARGYFSHNSADGSAFWKRVQGFYGSAGYRYWSVGENLLWASPELSSSGALQSWMESTAHRVNLLSPRWREIGLAAVHVPSAPGFFGAREVTIVTADFGVRIR